MKNDTREIKDLERQQEQTWKTDVLCDRCKREFYWKDDTNKSGKEWLCPDCKNDIEDL